MYIGNDDTLINYEYIFLYSSWKPRSLNLKYLKNCCYP